jgi:hypothetical protein
MNKNLNGMTKHNRILNRFALMNTTLFNQWITLSNILYHWTHTTRHKEKENLTRLVLLWQKRHSLTDGLLLSFPLCSSSLEPRIKRRALRSFFQLIYIYTYEVITLNEQILPFSLSLSLFFLLVSIRTHVKTTLRYVCVTYRWTNEEK